MEKGSTIHWDFQKPKEISSQIQMDFRSQIQMDFRWGFQKLKGSSL